MERGVAAAALLRFLECDIMTGVFMPGVEFLSDPSMGVSVFFTTGFFRQNSLSPAKECKTQLSK